MIPVMQTKFGDKEGNCFAACLASIFETPLNNIPDFASPSEEGWRDRLTTWLRDSFGMTPIWVFPGGALGIGKPMMIAGGPAARGLPHSVVWQGGKMIHDPHPDGTGLEKIDDILVFAVIDPAVMARWIDQ